MKFKVLFPFLFIFPAFTYGQQLQIIGDYSAKGIVFSSEESPFWFHSNQRGRINELSNISTYASGLMTYQINEDSNFLVGAGILFQNGYIDQIQLDESFFGFENSWLDITVGRKQRKDLYKGLSATNENILWSLNARPLPGLSLKTTRPVYLSKRAGIGFQASLEEFITDDDRYVRDTRIHHKSAHLVIDKIPNFEISLGLEHFVQWAGISPEFGVLPKGLDDYLKMVTGREGNNDVGGEEANALGNHLGGYVAGIKTSIDDYNIHIIYNHLFEDGSGRRLGNTPDGRYGIYIEDAEDTHIIKWVDALMYELYYTKHQSYTSSGTDGTDNYFNNNIYRSGWTYESRILGVPFITVDEGRFRIDNNIVLVHHVGISGIAFERFPYKLLNSYRMNYGAKGGTQIPFNVFSSYIDINVYQGDLGINVQLGTDFSNIAPPNFGAGIQLTKILF